MYVYIYIYIYVCIYIYIYIYIYTHIHIQDPLLETNMFVGTVVCACSRHALDYEFFFFKSFVVTKGPLATAWLSHVAASQKYCVRGYQDSLLETALEASTVCCQGVPRWAQYMSQQIQSLSVCIWFHIWENWEDLSSCPVRPHPNLSQLCLDFPVFWFKRWPLSFFVSTIQQVIWPRVLLCFKPRVPFPSCVCVCVRVALFYWTDSGESLRCRSFITSEQRGTHPRSKIADIPPHPVPPLWL